MIRIINIDQLEFGLLWNTDSDANDCLVQKHAVAAPPRFECRIIDIRRIGSVVFAKQRVETLAGIESCPYLRRSDRPAVARLVTRIAPPAVAAEAFEEGILSVNLAGGRKGLNRPGGCR